MLIFRQISLIHDIIIKQTIIISNNSTSFVDTLLQKLIDLFNPSKQKKMKHKNDKD